MNDNSELENLSLYEYVLYSAAILDVKQIYLQNNNRKNQMCRPSRRNISKNTVNNTLLVLVKIYSALIGCCGYNLPILVRELIKTTDSWTSGRNQQIWVQE